MIAILQIFKVFLSLIAKMWILCYFYVIVILISCFFLSLFNSVVYAIVFDRQTQWDPPAFDSGMTEEGDDDDDDMDLGTPTNDDTKAWFCSRFSVMG